MADERRYQVRFRQRREFVNEVKAAKANGTLDGNIARVDSYAKPDEQGVMGHWVVGTAIAGGQLLRLDSFQGDGRYPDRSGDAAHRVQFHRRSLEQDLARLGIDVRSGIIEENPDTRT